MFVNIFNAASKMERFYRKMNGKDTMAYIHREKNVEFFLIN